MGTAYPEIFAALSRPFAPQEVKTKPGGGGRKLSYVTARTVANRLDEVLGPECWRQEFSETRDGMKCRLWYRIEEWSWKEDGGGFAGMAAEDDNEKSAYCLPLNAEALTVSGWREYHQLHVGDVILAYDPTDGLCKWTPVQRINIFDEPNPVVQLSSKSFNMICTPSHRWVVNRRDKGIIIKETKNLDTRDKILNAAPAVGGEHPLSPREAAILGWLATDGSIVHGSRASQGRSSNQFHATIHQSKEPYRTQIRELLGDDMTEQVLPPGERTFPGHAVASLTRERSVFRLRNQFARQLLGKAGIEDWCDLIELVSRLSVEARTAMFQAMLDGDGQHSCSGQLVFGKKSKPGVMEAFEILATLQGVALGTTRLSTVGDMPIRTLRKLDHVHAKCVQVSSARPIPVWCPTTSFGTWVTRWNSNITITGNSDSFKRAAAMLGVGRYLYQDGTPDFGAQPEPAHAANGHAPSPPSHRENPPASHRENPAPPSAPSNGSHHGAPTTGKALFAWAKKQDEETGLSVSEGIKAWGKSNGLPWSWIEWPTEAVVDAHAYALSKIAGPSVPGVQHGLPDGELPFAALKKRLKDTIRDLARHLVRRDDVTTSDCASALAVIRRLADVAHKPIISAIDPLTEEHRDTMLWYLDQAQQEIQAILTEGRSLQEQGS